MVKILILGKTGMLGRYFSKYFSNLYSTVTLSRKEFNPYTDDIKVLEQFITEGTYVLNCIGITNKNPVSKAEMFYINGIFPHLLEQIVYNRNGILIHPSTDCVFSGKKQGGMYTESCIEDIGQGNEYGFSKALGDKIKKSCVIRVSIIGEENKNSNLNLLQWVINEDGKKAIVNGYTNHYWNGITCLEYAKFIHHLIETKKTWKGIRHVYSPQTVTKFQLLTLIQEIYTLNNIKIIPIQEQGGDVYRNLHSNYSIQELGYNFPSIKEQIIQQKEFNVLS